MKLVLFRHGATAWSVTGRHTGRTDLPLTDAGRAEARSAEPLMRRVLGEGWPGRVVTSPLGRAVETARLVFPETASEQDDDLVEMDYGRFEGLTLEQIREGRPGWDLWRDGCPGGETVQDVARRADSFLASIAGETQPVTAVAHGHLIRILAARALALRADQGQLFGVGTATASCIEDIRGQPVVTLWNLSPSLAPR